jgi:hypothetical protein
MKLFKCQICQQVLYFENSVCVKCGHRLGYVPEIATLSALEPDGDLWRALAAAGGAYRFCANAAQKACNWLVEASSPGGCLSCRHTLECAECGDDPPEEFLNDQKVYLFAPLGCLQL